MTTQHSDPNDVDENVVTYPLAPASEATIAPETGTAAQAHETAGEHALANVQVPAGEMPVNGASPMPEAVSAGSSQEQPEAASSPASSEEAPTYPSVIAEEQPLRPFTDFIEEFRQAEARFQSAVGTYEVSEPFTPSANEPAEGDHSSAASLESAAPVEPGGELPAPKEPAVSPLLRPASRLRLPRHGSGRLREVAPVAPVALSQEAPATAPAETPSAREPVRAEETPRPPRRYRFDRREPAASAAAPALPTAAPRIDGNHPIEKEVTPSPATRTPAPPAQPAEPPAVNLLAALETPVAAAPEPPFAASEPASPIEQTAEVNPEDLPPLEYAELQKANSRRRRRSKHNGSVIAPATSTTPAAPAASTPAPTAAPAPNPKAAAPAPVSTPAVPPTPTAPVPAPHPTVTPPPAAPSGQYGILSGYTVNQMNQGDGAGPFMAPEPSPARGSMATQSSRPPRIERSAAPSGRSTEGAHVTISQLTGAITQAFQTQTDRMVAELRRSNQTPTNITVSMPTLPSNERVGVFVDVANLLYSARTLRITVDFGKLLDFLRGNRRLVRAHAYTPTSPQPGDEQMFLQAVKGLGYRITTKNYKTFASGAKKADLDLDLCMDVVRLVDAKAVDCIVLVSGDSDFMPMLDYCSDHGVRVEVAAFDEAMSATLRQSCDLFINLAMIDEIRV